MYQKNNKTRYLKKSLLFALYYIFLSCFVCLNLNAGELTFKEAFERMYIKNEALKVSESAVVKVVYEQKAARGLYSPKIWLEGKYTQIDDDMVIDLNDIRLIIGKLHGINPQILPSFESNVQDAHFSKANINFSWILFSGGKILAANRAADARVLEKNEAFLYTKSILITELAKRYYGYILSIEASGVYKQVLDSIETHLNQAKKLEKSGMLAQSERIHAEVAYAGALRKYKKSIRKTEIVQAGLKNTLSSREKITPVSPLFLTRKIKPVEEYFESARRENHLLKKLAAKKELAVQNYKAEFSSLLPKVFLFGKYELYQDDLTVLEPEWAAGLAVNFSLFEGFSNTNKMLAAKKQKQELRYFVAKAIRDIDMLVEKKYNELMMEIEQFDALEASMKYANENFRIHQKAFKAGMTTSISVVDAQLALSKVKIEKLNAVYEFDVALAELLEVCGLSEKYEEYQNHKDVEVMF